MAKETPATTYDDTAEYVVTVSRRVNVGSFKYLPRDNPTMTGALIKRIIEENGEDAIRSAELV